VGTHTCPRMVAADTRVVDISAVVAATAAAIGNRRVTDVSRQSPRSL
jgi:hypothetical protein